MSTMPYPSSVDAGSQIQWALYDGDTAASAQAILTATTAYFVPVYSQGSGVVTAIRWRVSGTPTGTTDVGIYDANGNLLSHLSANATNLSAVNTGTLATPVAITQGRYYLALWSSNATDTYSIGTNSSTMSLCLSVSSASGLPTTLSGATDSGKKPYLIGLLSGGFA